MRTFELYFSTLSCRRIDISPCQISTFLHSILDISNYRLNNCRFVSSPRLPSVFGFFPSTFKESNRFRNSLFFRPRYYDCVFVLAKIMIITFDTALEKLFRIFFRRANFFSMSLNYNVTGAFFDPNDFRYNSDFIMDQLRDRI